mgnify:CR=1 FL=1
MCRPVGGSREEACPGGHIGPPLRDMGRYSEPTEIGRKTDLANGAGRSPPPTGGAEQDGGVVVTPRPTEAPQVVLSNGPMWAKALTGRQGSCIDHPGQRRTAERLRRGREGWAGIGTEIIPKVPSNAGQSLSHGEAVTAPFTQGSLGDGGCGLPRRSVGPPRNDNGFLSFRGQCAHWTWESVLFTMDGGSGRRT